MNLKFTYSAQGDLIRLREFIAEKNPQAAERISQNLKQSIGKLTLQPRMGFIVRGLPDVRDLVSGDYIVRYTVLRETVFILKIWHGREDR